MSETEFHRAIQPANTDIQWKTTDGTESIFERGSSYLCWSISDTIFQLV